MRTTTYRFEVAEEAFEGTLDIVSSLLSNRLFTESATDRELNAVDPENAKTLVLDNRRQLQLLKACGTGHEYLKFSTGNMKTLRDTPMAKGINVRKALVEFHAKYYRTKRMTLAVLGKASLDDLEASVRRCFHAFPFGNDEHYLPKDTFHDPFPKTFPCPWPLLVQSTPCKPKLRQLSLTWTIPPTLHNEAGTVSEHLGHLGTWCRPTARRVGGSATGGV